MKKVICLAVCLLLSMVMLLPALAAENFVPSIEYKDGPEIKDSTLDGEDISKCLVVTSILMAREKTTDIYQQDRDVLLGVYEALCDGSMKLPLEKDYVIRELVDVSFRKTPCIQGEHSHKEKLEEENVTVTVKFDLGIRPEDKLFVLAYVNGKWEPIESVTNNGDGTLTCVFEDICPVVFCLEKSGGPSQTGDMAGQNLLLWFILMIVSMAAVVTMLAKHRKLVG